MRSRKKWFAVSCAVVLGIAVLPSVGLGVHRARAFLGPRFDDRPNIGHMAGPVGRYLVLLSHLDLTDAQREDITTIVKNRRDEIVPAARAVVERRRALRKAMLSEPLHEGRIREAASELGKAVGDVCVLTSDILVEVRGVLTPEQAEQLEAFREARESTREWLEEIAGSLREE